MTWPTALAGSGSANFVLYPVTVVYQSDFEPNNGSLAGTNNWQWGAPTVGPRPADPSLTAAIVRRSPRGGPAGGGRAPGCGEDEGRLRG
jgi:hypothetical protein